MFFDDKRPLAAKEAGLSAQDSSGRQISLLNDSAAAAAAAAAAAIQPTTTTTTTTSSTMSMNVHMNSDLPPRPPFPEYDYGASPPSPTSSSVSSCDESNHRSSADSSEAITPPTWASPQQQLQQQQKQQQQQQGLKAGGGGRRKYHCTEPGCNKSFTTSGHLARHNRIHTGEKNFPCLFPGCQSRFSRQDNMMQHYRTHMSPKSRRTQRSKPSASSLSTIAHEEVRPRPRLHAHHRIRSDPFGVDPPLTIDQHLSNYHRSLNPRHPPPPSPQRQTIQQPLQQPAPVAAGNERHPSSPSPQSERAVSALPSSDTPATTAAAAAAQQSTPVQQQRPSHRHQYHHHHPQDPPQPFYQHRPLTLWKPTTQPVELPFTLLHPPMRDVESLDEEEQQNLLQLANVVTTFG